MESLSITDLSLQSHTTCPILFIEPFYGGSHKVLIDNLIKYFQDYTLVTLPAKKWHWRARCGALCIENRMPDITTEKVLFCSSVLSLAELLGLRPDLNSLKKVVYFHENQFVYPVREIKGRDIQFAYNQITTCLAADIVIFNSNFNKDSFLSNISSVIKILPDYRPKDVVKKIEPKCIVIYFPVEFPRYITHKHRTGPLHIVWPHRWEFDKGPDEFFKVMVKLKNAGAVFKLSILGETYTDVPSVFNESRTNLAEEILHFGYVETKEGYYDILSSCHVVVSTAKHEFFGVSMLEATFCGCYPLAPNALVYPEIYPNCCLYNTLDELYDKLMKFSISPELVIEERLKLSIDFSRFDKEVLIPKFKESFQVSS